MDARGQLELTWVLEKGHGTVEEQTIFGAHFCYWRLGNETSNYPVVAKSNARLRIPRVKICIKLTRKAQVDATAPQSFLLEFLGVMSPSQCFGASYPIHNEILLHPICSELLLHLICSEILLHLTQNEISLNLTRNKSSWNLLRL